MTSADLDIFLCSPTCELILAFIFGLADAVLAPLSMKPHLLTNVGPDLEIQYSGRFLMMLPPKAKPGIAIF
jgi:hypothetical protein